MGAQMNVTEEELRNDRLVQRLLKNPNWEPAAEAAIAFYIRGEECPIPGWKKSSTWAQVKMVYDKLAARQDTE